MLDSSDKVVKAAYPGMAVTVTGWKSLPNAGDEVLQGTEANVKKAVANRERKADLEATMEIWRLSTSRGGSSGIVGRWRQLRKPRASRLAITRRSRAQRS
jgi:hypothetical protein